MMNLYVWNYTTAEQSVRIYAHADADHHVVNTSYATVTVESMANQKIEWPENTNATVVRIADAESGDVDTVSNIWVYGIEGSTKNLQLVGSSPYMFRLV